MMCHSTVGCRGISTNSEVLQVYKFTFAKRQAIESLSVFHSDVETFVYEKIAFELITGRRCLATCRPGTIFKGEIE